MAKSKKKTPEEKKALAESQRAAAAAKVTGTKAKGSRRNLAQSHAMSELRKKDNAQIKARRAAKEAENSTFNNADYNRDKKKHGSM